ncbi:hypothetical protein AX17_005519 [Amanita inopinata Kibby_2008]|nr:hypothetical protein AX17_005519 [Amanita inopinata Kibby_2008]
MAAMVDRPVSAMNNSMDSAVPQRRRRESIEIIDVDLLDDDITSASRHSSSQPQQRPLQRRRQTTASLQEPETISLLDSDDEEPIVTSTTNTRRTAHRARLFSPPPQPQRASPIPPVPAVPRRFSSHTSLPMRRWPPAYPHPPVRPIARPFDFEANHHGRIPGPSNSHVPLGPRRVLSPPLQASAASHHVPSMGLGGALISSYRDQRAANQHPGLLSRAGVAASGLASRLSRSVANLGLGLGPGAGYSGRGLNLLLNPSTNGDEALARFLAETEMQELFGDFAHRPLLRHLSRDHRFSQSATYQPAYTHPSPPDSGFTHDFAPEPTSPRKPPEPSSPIIVDDEDANAGPSSSARSKHARRASSASTKSSTVLVCARCLDPLLLSAGLINVEQERRKVWALRCGHMIDGKCLREIGEPSVTASESEEEIISKRDVKGKGKARAPSIKGKGKAKTVDEDQTTESEPPGHDHKSFGTSPPASTTINNSIRSRLRSYSSTNVVPEPSVSIPTPSGSATTRRKRPPKKPKIEGEYRFLCPVVGCGCIHVSVKVGGEWRPERDEDRKKPGGRRTLKFPDDLMVDVAGGIEVRGRGPIPVFV